MIGSLEADSTGAAGTSISSVPMERDAPLLPADRGNCRGGLRAASGGAAPATSSAEMTTERDNLGHTFLSTTSI